MCEKQTKKLDLPVCFVIEASYSLKMNRKWKYIEKIHIALPFKLKKEVIFWDFRSVKCYTERSNKFASILQVLLVYDFKYFPSFSFGEN